MEVAGRAGIKSHFAGNRKRKANLEVYKKIPESCRQHTLLVLKIIQSIFS
jgi:hypothetical protein